MSREDGRVDRTLEVVHNLVALLVRAPHALAEEDHGTSRSTQTLVGSGRHDVRVFERRGNNATGDQARNVCHVAEQVAADLVRNALEALVVDQSAVCTGSCDDDLRPVQHSQLFQLVVVDQTGLLVKPVWERLEVFADSADLLVGELVAVGQVATVGQVEAHDSVVCVEKGGVCVEVCG